MLIFLLSRHTCSWPLFYINFKSKGINFLKTRFIINDWKWGTISFNLQLKNWNLKRSSIRCACKWSVYIQDDAKVTSLSKFKTLPFSREHSYTLHCVISSAEVYWGVQQMCVKDTRDPKYQRTHILRNGLQSWRIFLSYWSNLTVRIVTIHAGVRQKCLNCYKVQN
jgi:hypothetical protein